MRAKSAASASEVSGPVAMTSASAPAAASRTERASARTSSMSGCSSTSAVTAPENAARSTASAPPAGTAWRRAAANTNDPSASSSRFSMPAALSGFVLLSEFEHTSSAQSPDACTGVGTAGRISTSRTRIPRAASCKAASLPARPAPSMVTEEGMRE